jgi:thiamine-phosphate pyrophosphorylase
MKDKIIRIIDVNINRAREGLRVVEDIIRLYYDNKIITKKVKRLRHLISESFSIGILLDSRDSRSDVGRKISFDKISGVKSVTDVLLRNLIRIQESLRVLEEFSKMADPKKTGLFKKARFELYDIEKELFKKIKK